MRLNQLDKCILMIKDTFIKEMYLNEKLYFFHLKFFYLHLNIQFINLLED